VPLGAAVLKPDVFERHEVRERLARTRRMERKSLEMNCQPGSSQVTTRSCGDPVPPSFSAGVRPWRHSTIRKLHEVPALHAGFRLTTDAGVATT
jgi:hypothetical protein